VKPGLFQKLVLVLFGRGRISEMMGDFGRGIKSFKKGIGEEDGAAPVLDAQSADARPAQQPAADKTAG
jgi:sec-independent protein translocase protein TatA